MKKLLFLLPILLISTCHLNNDIVSQSESNNDQISPSDDLTMNLYVDNILIDVSWENNPSVKALEELSKDVLTIELQRYGGFEQTGQIGQAIVSNDVQMDVDAGDIVLYNSRQICLYYDKNSWSFTKLGKMNLSKDKIVKLLDKESITMRLETK